MVAFFPQVLSNRNTPRLWSKTRRCMSSISRRWHAVAGKSCCRHATEASLENSPPRCVYVFSCFHGGCLYTVESKTCRLHILDAKTGEELEGNATVAAQPEAQSAEGGLKIDGLAIAQFAYASPVVTARNLFFFDDAGNTAVLKRPRDRPAHVNKLDNALWGRRSSSRIRSSSVEARVFTALASNLEGASCASRIVFAVWLALAGYATASDWPHWAGPKGDCTTDEKGLLKQWPEGGPEVLWRIPVGTGSNHPSVAGEDLCFARSWTRIRSTRR